MACGAGAGLAAVYNVPLGGALFTAEVLIGAINLPVVLPALACAGVATLTGWLYLPDRPTYADLPAYPLHARLLVWAVLAGPVLGVLAAGYIRLIGWVSHHRARGALVLVTPLAAFGVLALLALRYPQLYGNGKRDGARRVPRPRQHRVAGRAERAEAAGHRAVPEQRRVRRPVHPGAQYRRGARRAARRAVEPALARFADRRVRDDRGGGHDRRRHAGPAGRAGAGAGADPQPASR